MGRQKNSRKRNEGILMGRREEAEIKGCLVDIREDILPEEWPLSSPRRI